MSGLKTFFLSLIEAKRVSPWVPTDFAAFGGWRDAVDKMLQSLVRDGELQRIDRGL